MSKLIIIEGLDGSGKSTQTELIEKYLQNENIDYRKIKLPDYDSPSSSLVKMYLNGINTYSLAEAFNCHRVTVSRILKDAGIKYR